jgi:hypothetical protein
VEDRGADDDYDHQFIDDTDSDLDASIVVEHIRPQMVCSLLLF